MTSKRLLLSLVATLLLAVAAFTAATVAAAGSSSDARYYLALGDSLSTGFQPTLRGMGIETHSGYVDDIYARERRRTPNLELIDFGCPGDTTTSLLTGVGNDALARRLHCDRAGGSQLGAALSFLRSHDLPGQVPLITIDIGINDLNRCAALSEPAACLRTGQAAISTNLPRLLRELRAAAPEGTVLAAMTLYDTYLGRTAAQGANVAGAQAFLEAYGQANATIAADDAAAGFRTAGVAAAFHTYDTAPVSWRGTRMPSNLVRACSLTWSCSAPPINHNIHPDGHGYRVIARAFESVIGRLVQVRRRSRPAASPNAAPIRTPGDG